MAAASAAAATSSLSTTTQLYVNAVNGQSLTIAGGNRRRTAEEGDGDGGSGSGRGGGGGSSGRDKLSPGFDLKNPTASAGMNRLCVLRSCIHSCLDD